MAWYTNFVFNSFTLRFSASMLAIFGKKRISEDKVANVLVNTLLEYVENGFPQVADIINVAPEFEIEPAVSRENDEDFLLILLVGNLNFIPIYFDYEVAERINLLVVEKFAKALDTSVADLKKKLKAFKTFLVQKNHPSKNMLYAMSKGMFYKYNLNDFQEEYFKLLKTPNPIFLKRLDELMGEFVFNWEEFVSKYKVVH
jgi:hypothetical protein